MPLSRRELLKLSLSSAASLLLPAPLRAWGSDARPLAPRKTLSIVQGATDESRTQFSLVHPSGIAPRPRAALADGNLVEPDRVVTLRFPGQPTAVTQAFFSGLPSGEDLRLLVRGEGENLLDERIFRTLDPEKEELSFALCSCMHDAKHDAKIWNDLATRAPDILLFLGDSTYCDHEGQKPSGRADPATLWRRFSEARSTLEIYHQKRLFPILAVWDDHDFGANNGDSTNYPYLEETRRNFLSFFPQDPAYCRYLENGPGISLCLSFRGQRLVLLDDRSFRLASGSLDRFAHWGRAQEDWALEKVSEHAGVTWLMNGSQFFPDVPWKESVSRDHPRQLEGFVQGLAATGRKVLFASGDVHYSEISRIQPEMLAYETFEITSSSIHSPGIPGAPHIIPNPKRIVSTGKRNYVLVSCTGKGAQARYLVQSLSHEGLHFRREISLG